MKQTSKQWSPLVAAANELEAQLRHFGELAQALQKAPLNSQKKIQQMARMFQGIADADTRITELVQNLNGALTDLRVLQQKEVDGIQARAEEFSQRTAILQELMQAYGTIGQSAAQLNGLLQDAAAMPQEGAKAATEKALRLAEMGALMDGVVEQARLLVHEATENDFRDIASLAEGVCQQLGDARKKIRSLQMSLERN